MTPTFFFSWDEVKTKKSVCVQFNVFNCRRTQTLTKSMVYDESLLTSLCQNLFDIPNIHWSLYKYAFFHDRSFARRFHFVQDHRLRHVWEYWESTTRVFHHVMNIHETKCIMCLKWTSTWRRFCKRSVECEYDSPVPVWTQLNDTDDHVGCMIKRNSTRVNVEHNLLPISDAMCLRVPSL